jgi:nucleoside 2-deoxyribosyltransferase
MFLQEEHSYQKMQRRQIWIFKMKCFISYRFTGEDPKELEETLKHVCNLLIKVGHSHYCSFWDGVDNGLFEKNDFTNKQVLEYALNEIDKADCVVVFIKSENKSEGMLMEIGYALAKKKKIFLLIKKGVKTTFVRELADEIIEFDNLTELKKLELSF